MSDCGYNLSVWSRCMPNWKRLADNVRSPGYVAGMQLIQALNLAISASYTLEDAATIDTIEVRWLQVVRPRPLQSVHSACLQKLLATWPPRRVFLKGELYPGRLPTFCISKRTQTHQCSQHQGMDMQIGIKRSVCLCISPFLYQSICFSLSP